MPTTYCKVQLSEWPWARPRFDKYSRKYQCIARPTRGDEHVIDVKYVYIADRYIVL